MLDLLGEGGMGMVYLAEQKEPVRRKVALKIIKPGMDSRQVIARFESERQTLAVLDHPNIAHVFDAGCTETARPYFVMEHVKGLPITSYCDQNRLTIERRLRLFEQVCEAVHHAHQKGIIHRDLKPSNILVCVHGDRATPKIIDFGIARAITAPLTDKTFVTLQGQLLGTPEYMSPEQVDLATQDIDIRSDIYSLGVVLYELLAGVLPFESEFFAKAGLAQIQQTIREQEPASPSIRLTSLGERAKTIAASRGTQVVPLARRLHRELEWIPLKAMRKDRCRRYKSASEMADDIRNYLHGNPLLAGPETTIYRAQKFIRKHAGSVTTVALVTVAVMLGLVVSTAMYFRSEQSLRREAIARTQAEQAQQKEAEARVHAESAEAATKEKAEELRRTLYVNSIQLADAKYREGNTGKVRELLAACPNDLRGWEWNRLNHVMDQSSRTLRGHERAIYSIALSPDDKQIASGALDGTIKLWNLETGMESATLHGHATSVHSVAYSPDGRLLAVGGLDGKLITDGTIRVWDISKGEEMMAFPRQSWALSLAFSPDGRCVISACQDKTIKIWNTTTGIDVMVLPGHKDWAQSVGYSPDGSCIISGGRDGTIKVWNAETDAEVLSISAHEGTGAVWQAAFSPDGKRIVSSCDVIKVWDAETGGELMTISGHTTVISSVFFSPDGKRLMSCSWDGEVKVWNAATGVELISLVSPMFSIYSVALSPDGRTIAAGGLGGLVVWETEKPTGGYERRQNAGAAAMVVDSLYREGSYYYKVIDQLQSDLTLDQSTRSFALQIANSRKLEDADRLKSEVWAIVLSSERDAEAYRAALEKAQRVNGWEPNDCIILTMLAAAQYRTGSHEDAWKTLSRVAALRDDGDQSDPASIGFAAMSLQQLGRLDEAKATLGRLRDLLRDGQFTGYEEEAKALLAEAEAVIEGGKK